MIDLIQEIRQHWLSEDGLMRLDPDDDREPFEGACSRTVKNQNGIMFLAEVLLSLKEKGLPYGKFKDEAYWAIKKLQVEPGLFSRNQGNTYFQDSHDNMLGIVVICSLYDFKDILGDIVFYGLKHGWVFDNLRENTPVSYFTAMRQGKDIAVYKLAWGGQPYLLELLWLFGSALVPSDLRLLKLRLSVAKMAYDKFQHSTFLLYERILELAYQWKGGDLKYALVVEDYFKDPNHPMRVLWKS